MEDSTSSTASNVTAPDSEITALCECFPTIDLVSQILSEQDKLILEISLREYISTASIISYGEGKYTPLHIFIEVLNHFVVQYSYLHTRTIHLIQILELKGLIPKILLILLDSLIIALLGLKLLL